MRNSLGGDFHLHSEIALKETMLLLGMSLSKMQKEKKIIGDEVKIKMQFY